MLLRKFWVSGLMIACRPGEIHTGIDCNDERGFDRGIRCLFKGFVLYWLKMKIIAINPLCSSPSLAFT